MGKLVSVAEFARYLQVTPAAVYAAIKRQRIQFAERGRLDQEACLAAWNANTTPQVGRPKAVMPVTAPAVPPIHSDPDDAGDRPEANDNEGYFNARARREAAKADLAELEVKERLKDLVAVTDVQRGWDEVLRATRGALEAVPDRCATLATGDIDEQRRLAELWRGEVSAVLHRLAEDIRAMGAREGAEA